jgi:two-component system response regulator HupR/HoxA
MKRSSARIIAATNRNLDEDVRAGRFRRDLYHRLNILSFHIPPLRRRRCDIPLLTRFIFDTIERRYGLGPFSVGESALRLMLDYEWPGNVRELQGEIVRAAIKKRRGTLGVFDFSSALFGGINRTGRSRADRLVEKVEALERREIVRALSETGGNHTRAASLLGLGRTTLLYKIKKLGWV